MRLHLVIQRHGLPVTRILWTTGSPVQQYAAHALNAQPATSASAIVSTRTPNAAFSSNGGYTIAQLLEDVNEVVPLETEPTVFNDETTGQWGLEDYVVELAGSECLHFMDVEGLLRDGDEVVIRALQTADLRARRLSGRHQISMDGKHLIDGVPFGRPFLKRTFSSRPAIAIPPRKRRRTLVSGWTADQEYVEEDTEWGVPPPPPPHHGISRRGTELQDDFDGNVDGTVIRHTLAVEEEEDEDQSDSEEADYADSEELAEELDDLKEDLDAAGYLIDRSEQQRHSGYSLRRRDQKHAERRDYKAGRPSSALVTIDDTSPKRESSRRSSKLVRFEQAGSSSMALAASLADRDGSQVADGQNVGSEDPKELPHMPWSALKSPEHDNLPKSDSEESPSSGSEASISSSDEVSASVSDSEEESTSESEMDEIPETVTTTRPRPKVNPPGHGSAQTKKSNLRNKLKRRLSKLKELGALPPEADFAALRTWEERNGNKVYVPIPSKVVGEGRTALAQPAAAAFSEAERPSNGDDFAAAVDDSKNLSLKAKERAEFEAKRQKLLSELASGGIDVSEYVDKENIPPLNNAVVGQVNVASTQVNPQLREDDFPAEGTGGLKSLDVTGSQRPEEIASPLAGHLESVKSQGAAEIAPAHLQEGETEVNWQERLIVKATECVFDDIELSAPPFPFQQRWDSKACELIRKRKGRGKGRKGKRQDWYQYYDDQFEAEGEGEYEEGYENVVDSFFDGEGELNYNDAEPMKDEETVSKVLTEDAADAESVDAVADDLPALPENISSLPDLTENEVAVGGIIAFKQLDMSKATNWQPRVSAYRVAAIAGVNGDLIKVQLAKCDRRPRPESNGDEEGGRLYSGFEMPGFEDDEEDDEGYREMTFDNFIAPKLLRASARSDAGQREEASQNSIVSLEEKGLDKINMGGRTGRERKSLPRNETIHVPSTPEPVVPDGHASANRSPESAGHADVTVLPFGEGEQDESHQSPAVQSPKFSGFSPFPNFTPTGKRQRKSGPEVSDPVSIEVSISCQQADNEDEDDDHDNSDGAQDNFFDSSSPSRGNVFPTLLGSSDLANDSLSYISTGGGKRTGSKKRSSESSASHGSETVPNPFYDIDKAHEERRLRKSEELLAQDSMGDAQPSVEMSSVRSISQVDGADDDSSDSFEKSSSSSSSSPSSEGSASPSPSPLFSTARTNRSENRSSRHSPADSLSRDPVDEIQESILAPPPPASPPPAAAEPQSQVSVVVDLTMSSPPQSPSGSDNEDYAKTHRKPRGSGWVQKSEKPPPAATRSSSVSTRRRTRSAAGSQVQQTLKEVSISPPQRKTAARRRRGSSSSS